MNKTSDGVCSDTANASGVAALLELTSRWAADPPRRPILLVAFDQEKWGIVCSAPIKF